MEHQVSETMETVGERAGLSYEEAMRRAPDHVVPRAKRGQFSREVAKKRRDEQNKRANLARYRAFRALALAHPDQYDEYLREAKAAVAEEFGPLVAVDPTDDPVTGGNADE